MNKSKLFGMLVVSLFLVFLIETVNASPIEWYDYETGIAKAEITGQPMMIYIYADHAPSINFDDPDVIEAASNFICIRVNSVYGENLLRENNIYYIPTIVFVNTEKQEILRLIGADSKNLFSTISEAWIKKDEAGKTFQLFQLVEYEKHNLGEVTIKEYNSHLNNLDNEKWVEVDAEINEVTIRKLSGPGVNSRYSLTLDDGTSTISLTYEGGLGDINIGDKVNVKIDSHKITEISKSSIVGSQYKTTSSDDTSSKTTPGFGLIAGVSVVFVLFFIWKKMRD